jgi:hypothetical protein
MRESFSGHTFAPVSIGISSGHFLITIDNYYEILIAPRNLHKLEVTGAINRSQNGYNGILNIFANDSTHWHLWRPNMAAQVFPKKFHLDAYPLCFRKRLTVLNELISPWPWSRQRVGIGPNMADQPPCCLLDAINVLLTCFKQDGSRVSIGN